MGETLYKKSKLETMDLLIPDLGYFFWGLIIFLILLLVLAKYAWKPIINMLNEREKNIEGAIAQAEKIKAEMAQLQNENEALLAKAREERAQLMKEARETKEKIISEAKDQAKIEAGKIIADSQLAIEAQKMAAITDVKNEVGKLVIEVSEKILKQELSAGNKQEDYINKMVDAIKFN